MTQSNVMVKVTRPWKFETLTFSKFLPRAALRGLRHRNSIRPSVSLVVCVYTVRPMIMVSSPYGSPMILVSVDITFIPKFEGGHPKRGRWMRVGWVRIGDFRPISLKRCKIRQRLLLITNRKSNTRFRLVPK